MSKLLLLLLFVLTIQAQQCKPAIQIDKQPQVLVLSDISNEPDDTMSFVRLLLHSDQYNITGMVATTSTWLRNATFPDQILHAVQAYGKVRDNLSTHSAGRFPTEDYLASIIHSGHPVFGTAAIGPELSSGAKHLIEVADGLADDDVLYIQAWGGTNVVAEALAFAHRTRAAVDFDNFFKKLRLYAISDQDNAGPWIREHFPKLPYIVSIHGFNQYRSAAWTGISGEQLYNFDVGGPDSSLVTDDYIKNNFQIGPLGSIYPDVAYIMEGDSPSLMYSMQNGLNGGPFDQPSWGGWGGRYVLQDRTGQTNVYSDVTDKVVGKNNQTFNSAQATIWRWRQAYQDEMSARVQWSVKSEYSVGNHPPVVSVNGSCGSSPLELEVTPEETITLDASATYHPDANLTGEHELQFRWFHYRDVTADQNTVAVPQLNFTLSEGGRKVQTQLPNKELGCPDTPSRPPGCYQYHIILEVTPSGDFPIRRYKRVILRVRSSEDPAFNTRRKRDEL